MIKFGPKGELKGPGAKMIVTQARTVWLFCRLARAGYDGEKALDAAELGFDSLAWFRTGQHFLAPCESLHFP